MWNGVGLIQLAQDKDERRAVENTVIKPRNHKEVGNFMIGWTTVSFSWGTLLRAFRMFVLWTDIVVCSNDGVITK
jgi:hypothetical protein